MTKIIILAAGKGTRMGSDLPKVLVPLNGRPMISYLMDSVVASGVDSRPIVVVSPDNKDVIAEVLKDYQVDFAIQDKQLGTGHAVSCALPFVSESVEKILVLYGDHPFLKSDSIKLFSSLNPQALTIMPAVLSDFDDWRHNFYHWGRIIRGANSNVEKIVEFKDASDEEKIVTEVNPGFMCFNKNWLQENINRLRDDNNNKEYYLTDMVKIAFEENIPVSTSNIEAREAMGVNSPDELAIAESLLR
jgi:bifunctional UDP-N-acetylglucosamine pyrophosphorylase/glucosamine-1-phosphate N-acetyltransferase